LLLTGPRVHAQAWHLSDWPARAVVEIRQPLSDAGVDTAAARVLTLGKTLADGRDYRVLDEAGKPVPFQLTFHDPARYSLLAFRAVNPRQKFFIYFGNSKATRAAEEVVVDPAPGAGPPRGAWVPRHGLVLQTMQRPKGDNPKTAADMAKLISGSPSKYGARYQRKIADGYNPFGPSDYYISIYRGWINIPTAGKYQFCTISNEASFSFLDGKELIHWPGRHTVERGMRGEKNTKIDLAAGLHYLEYYHEEVTLDQMAYLGWRPSGDEGPFAPIPEVIFTAPHAGVVTRYEDAKGPLLHFEPVITDSVWPTERAEGQYTRCRFHVGRIVNPSHKPIPTGTSYRWDFGDGQSATGPEAEHVYLTLGTYPVTLTAEGTQGKSTVRWPLEVYEIEHVTEQFKEGRPRDYHRLALTYDRGKLDAAQLKELAYLLAESENPAEAVTVGQEFLKRFGNQDTPLVPRMHRLMADCAIRLGKGQLDLAIANYQKSLGKDTPLAEKLDVLARLIRLLGIERKLPEKGTAIMTQVEETIRGQRMDDEVKSAYRRTLVAAGDVQLWHGKAGDARTWYQRAETFNANFIPPQVRAARIGAYPNSIREFVDSGNYGAALDIVARWDEAFPLEKLKGQTFFWRGKLQALRGQHEEAARYLARAIGLAVGASFESEARWLLALSLEDLGRPEDARRECARLLATGINDQFTKMARKKLKK